MSEPDAVPLPREGEVFFDVRGDAWTMRLSWYADSKVAVFSIWQGNRCTGTFRLPFTDLTRMIQTLEAGPLPQVPPPGTSSYQGLEHRDSGFGDSVDYGHSRDYGRPAYGERHGAGYGQADYGGSGGDQAHGGYGSGQASAPERGYGGEYQDAFGRDRGTGTDLGPSYSGRPRPDDQFTGGSEYSEPPADRSHDPGWQYGSNQPDGTSQPYGEPYAEPYGAGQPYDSGQRYGSAQRYGSVQHYSPAERYSPDPPYAPAQSYGSSVPYSSGQPYPAAAGQQYGTAPEQQSNYGLPDYDPANHGDLGANRDADRAARSDHQLEAESVPETAMLSFPSVPARNGPYR